MAKRATSGLRVLGRLRLSRSTEESTSIERQRELVQQWAEANGHHLVGWAEDVDVSGSIDPFDTPSLGPWLSDRAPEWDVLACCKLDRLGRNAIQLNKLFGWCFDHDKTVVSVTESIDLGTPVGRLIANVIAFLAEGELEAIRERTRASKQKLRESARWGGGKPPYGYLGLPRTDGPGHQLVVDPLASTVVRRIVDSLLDGVAVTRIARDLTEERYLTPGDYYATVKAGTPTLQAPEGETDLTKWNSTPLRNMLRSPALRGFAHHKAMTVRDDNGEPVKLAEPLVTLDEWELIQAHLDRIQESRSGIRQTETSPLLGVALCWICETPLHLNRYHVKDSEYRYYRCQNRRDERHVNTSNVPADWVEQMAEESFLYEVSAFTDLRCVGLPPGRASDSPGSHVPDCECRGDLEVRERVWVPGDSHETELREAVAALDELTAAAGGMASATARQRLMKQISALDARIAELESAPSREARWEYRSTGELYRDVWSRSDTDQRRDLLVRSGITVAAAITDVHGRRIWSNQGVTQFAIRVPEQIRNMTLR